MAFTLPALSYAYDALAPYMSKETLEFHHDKHHKAYVDKGNELIAGTGLESMPLEEAMDQIKSWNLHIFVGRKPRGLLLGSDVVFVEPPLA